MVKIWNINFFELAHFTRNGHKNGNPFRVRAGAGFWILTAVGGAFSPAGRTYFAPACGTRAKYIVR